MFAKESKKRRLYKEKNEKIIKSKRYNQTKHKGCQTTVRIKKMLKNARFS